MSLYVSRAELPERIAQMSQWLNETRRNNVLLHFVVKRGVSYILFRCTEDLFVNAISVVTPGHRSPVTTSVRCHQGWELLLPPGVRGLVLPEMGVVAATGGARFSVTRGGRFCSHRDGL